MGTISETPLPFPLENKDCSGDVNSESSSSDFFIPKLQENEDFGEPQPSCSGLNLRPKSKSVPKGQEPNKPSFPWKYLLPKRGVSKLIFQVVASTEKRSGISLQALKKSVAATGYDLEKKKNYFKRRDDDEGAEKEEEQEEEGEEEEEEAEKVNGSSYEEESFQEKETEKIKEREEETKEIRPT
ncbi:hypothetical protein JD844_001894 [Phrynosoma platyrhinos]|uniref:Uncharacterized protein n=1 Tax=Phrynosoma platyrhinos TaxID=52577 RepID=A0ABQ7TAJ9_PHRPL|nr:hypothetical protein JD844_001894 [Phrynosoma platyrhinos]